MIDGVIERYGLSRSTEKGYSYYGCESAAGLGKYNREPFLRLRDDFNKKNVDYDYYTMLYVLIVYAFNNQIRFNSKGEFNLPVGKRDFNDKMKSKLCTFADRLQEGNFTLSCTDFRAFDTTALTSDSLVYCDPPYLITCATYNEQGGWDEHCERDLLAMLDALDMRGVRFVLSNVLSSKGKKNVILTDWLGQRGYRTVYLDYNYSNSNYHTRDRTESTQEVLILNY
jgi:DNA adenine methylase Dam